MHVHIHRHVHIHIHILMTAEPTQCVHVADLVLALGASLREAASAESKDVKKFKDVVDSAAARGEAFVSIRSRKVTMTTTYDPYEIIGLAGRDGQNTYVLIGILTTTTSRP